MDKKRYESALKTNLIDCAQCGQKVPYTIWAKRKERGKLDWDKCRDCTATPSNAVRTIHAVLGVIVCYPYTGELDDLWRPIDGDGELYLPGERLCGLKDCVNRNHVIGLKYAKKPKQITDLELLMSMVEVQDYNKRARTNGL